MLRVITAGSFLLVLGLFGWFLVNEYVSSDEGRLSHNISVESNLARLSPDAKESGYAIPASGSSIPVSLTAVCNDDGSATFSWYALGASSYNYHLNNITRGPWEFVSQPCSASPINGDYCGDNVMTTSLTVGSGSMVPQEYSFRFWYNTSYFDYGGGGGSVISSLSKILGLFGGSQKAQIVNTEDGGSRDIVCPANPILPTCSITVGDCTLPNPGVDSASNFCDAPVTWSASGVINNKVKIVLQWPDGRADLWSRYGWSGGEAPASWSGTIASLWYPGTYTAKVFDLSNRECASDAFTVSGTVCEPNAPYAETNIATVQAWCHAQHGNPLPAGMTYPASVACNAAPGWKPYGPACTAPNCTCTLAPVPVVAKPDLESVPENLALVKPTETAFTRSRTITVGEALHIIGTVRNRGTAEALAGYVDRFQYRYRPNLSSVWTGWSNINPDISGVALGVWPGGSNGGAQNESTTYTFGNAGYYEVRHCVDDTDVVDELDPPGNTNNCTPAGNILTVTVLTTPSGGSGIVQGYHVNSSRQIYPTAASVPIRVSSLSGSGNPYIISNVPTGNQMISSDPLPGHTISYCVHEGGVNCSTATYTTGNSVTRPITDGSVTNVWWMYSGIRPTVTLEGKRRVDSTWGEVVDISSGDHIDLKWTAQNADTCRFLDLTDVTTSIGVTGDTSGPSFNDSVVANEPTSGTKTYQLVCRNTTSGLEGQDFVNVRVVGATLSVSPSVVRLDEDTVVTYNTRGNTCTLSGKDVGGLTVNSVSVTSATDQTIPIDNIQGETKFTLDCGSAGVIERTVRILQSTIER